MPRRAGPDDGGPAVPVSETAPALRLQLFGEMHLELDGARLPPPESARARSLLAYLVLHPGPPQPRQRLAFLLWPDSTEGQARTNLRHLLHTLRAADAALDLFLDVTPHTLRWRHGPECWIDVAAFEAALAHADDDTGDVLPWLRAAIGLYAGDLLEGSYDEWLEARRERLRGQYASALERAGALLVERGQHREAIRLGRELLRCDPLREDTYRALMRTHDAAGDRAGAVRVYHECVSMLQRELAVEPSAATRTAYASLMRPGPPGAGAEQEPSRVGRAPLVGRRDEWEWLTHRWRETEDGRAQLVLVTGEPGIGKTRLAEELAGWCAHSGAIVAQARSYRSEGELGYGVVVSWLRTPDLAVNLRRATPSDRAELARLLPELGDGQALAGSDTADPEERRLRLFDAISRTLMAAGRPAVLIADDAQWCDAPSLQLIHYLVRLDPTRRLLVIGTVRREDLDHGHPLGALAAGLGAIDHSAELRLGRLTPADTAELARRLTGADIEPTAIDGLYAETEGNPLFVVETVGAGWDRSEGRGRALSPKLQAVIDVRLRQVSGPAREVLAMAATVGREFTAEVLAGASDMDEPTLVAGLDELWRRGIVREQGTEAYDFAHGKIRDVAYDALSATVRRRNHLRIAGALRKLRDRDIDAVSGEVAHHYDRAGEVDDAVAWYRRAAVQAQRLYADVEAVRLLARAAELVALLPDGATRRAREIEVLSALATPLAVVEGFASARLSATQRRVLELAGEGGVDPEPTLLRSLTMTSLCRDDFAGARDVTTRLRALAKRKGDDLLLVETEYLLGISAFWDGAFDAARQHFERVGDSDPGRRGEHLLRFGHDPLVVCLSRLANTLWFLGRTADARRARDEAVVMARQVGHPFSRGVTHAFAAALAADLDENELFREYAAALGTDAQHQPLRVAGEVFGGYADVLDGHSSEGIRRIRAAIDDRPVNHAPGQRALHLRLLVAAYQAAGDAGGGLKASDEALGCGGTRIWEAEQRRLRAGFLAALGAPVAEVDAELGRAAAVARDQGAAGPLARVERVGKPLGAGR